MEKNSLTVDAQTIKASHAVLRFEIARGEGEPIVIHLAYKGDTDYIDVFELLIKYRDGSISRGDLEEGLLSVYTGDDEKLYDILTKRGKYNNDTLLEVEIAYALSSSRDIVAVVTTDGTLHLGKLVTVFYDNSILIVSWNTTEYIEFSDIERLEVVDSTENYGYDMLITAEGEEILPKKL